MKSLRVLFVTPDLFGPPGGIARFSRLVCKALCESSCIEHLDVLSLNDAKGQKSDSIYLSALNNSYFSMGGNKARFLWQLIQLSTNRYDAYLTSHVNLALPLWLIYRLYHNRTVLVPVVHGIDVWERLPWFRRFPLIASSMVLAVSHLTKERMVRANKVPPEKVRILYNCLDPSFASEENLGQQSINVDAGWIQSPSILTVARLTKHDHYKGHTQVIQALAHVLQQIPALQYYIVGQGDLMPELQQLCVQLGVTSFVHFLGQVDEPTLRSLYAHTDLFVMPSKGEGFGLVYLEAMAYGMTVIAGNQDAAGEVVQHNKTGLLVDPDDISTLANSIIKLLTENELRKQMGSLGQQVARTKFSYICFKTDLLNYLYEALDEVSK